MVCVWSVRSPSKDTRSGGISMMGMVSVCIVQFANILNCVKACALSADALNLPIPFVANLHVIGNVLKNLTNDTVELCFWRRIYSREANSLMTSTWRSSGRGEIGAYRASEGADSRYREKLELEPGRCFESWLGYCEGKTMRGSDFLSNHGATS